MEVFADVGDHQLLQAIDWLNLGMLADLLIRVQNFLMYGLVKGTVIKLVYFCVILLELTFSRAARVRQSRPNICASPAGAIVRHVPILTRCYVADDKQGSSR
jgi:hypothetical protein